jgi:hypothetical protein
VHVTGGFSVAEDPVFFELEEFEEPVGDGALVSPGVLVSGGLFCGDIMRLKDPERPLFFLSGDAVTASC